MNDAQNMEKNRTSGFFMIQWFLSLNQFEVDTKYEIFIMVDEDDGDSAGTDREGES